MKTALAREHRKILESLIAQARPTAESGATKALQALAVGAKEAPAHFTEHDLRAKVGSDAESLERAQQLLTHASASTTKRIYRRKPEIVG